MPSSLRIARTNPGVLRSLIPDASALHTRLQALIRRFLPPVTASLLAEPRLAPDGRSLDWYSDLAGEPIAFTALSEEKQAAARILLMDRVASIERLADELPVLAPEVAELAEPLRRATRYPSEDCVYLVGGQPVLTFWGHAGAGGVVTAGTVVASQTRRWPLGPWLALLLLLAAGAVGINLWHAQRLEAELAGQLEAALAAGCDPDEPLEVLYRRLLVLDPAQRRYSDLWQRLAAARARCADAARYAEALAAARGDCRRLAVLRRTLAAAEDEAPPFVALGSVLEAELAVCAEAAALAARVDAAVGNCAALAALDREAGDSPTDSTPLLRVRARVDEELVRCGEADRLALALSERRGDCPALHRLDGRLLGLDTTRPPLSGVRAELDLELALCVKTEGYARGLLAAQNDCAALAAVEASMRGEPVEREPLRAVHRRLEELLVQCESLDDLARALEEARGDCGRLALLEQRLAEESPENPLFTEVRQAAAEERRGCDLVAELERALVGAEGDCVALAALELRLAAAPAEDRRFFPVRIRWRKAMDACRLADTLERKLDDAGDDCARLSTLRVELEAAEVPGIEALRARIDGALAPCRWPTAPVVAEAEDGPPPEKRTPKAPPRDADRKGRKILCPGERPKELAPELVMVFDASASMDRPIAARAALSAVRQGLQLGGLPGAALGILIDQAARGAGGPRRIEAAKDAAGRIVRSLPGDVDVGLVLVEDCPAARSVGFFRPAQRGSLVRGIDGIHPVGGTPLAAGIERAASMVDGVRKPAVMVILSDGKESCHRDPCAVARHIARRKPLLTINVVDITGTGAGDCAARATGGKVYPANDAQEVRAMLGRATQEVQGPPECRRK